MTATSERPADIACERADIGSLAAFGLELGGAGVWHIHQLKPVDFDRPGLQVDGLAVAGEVVGSLAADLDRRVLRRYLRDGPGVARDERFDGDAVRTELARRDHAAVGIVRVALLAPAHG